MLTLESLFAGYGDATVLDDCSLSMRDGESVALLGRNGVGKSSLLLTIMGHTRLRAGSMRWRGQDLAQIPVHARARAGLGWVPQEREVFPSLTVEENLTVTALPGKWNLAAIYGLFPRLRERRKNFGNQLSGGEQQMLAIGRALMADPKIILLDEPSMGLAPVIVLEVFNIIRRLKEAGITLLLVEQFAKSALEVADYAYVMEHGGIAVEGTPDELNNNEKVLAAYLG